MRWFVSVLLGGYLVLSLTPQSETPGGLGVGIAWQRGDDVTDTVLEVLNPPVWMNWIYDHMHDPAYLPMAFSANPAYSQRYIDAALDQPGRTWLLLNEPNCCETTTAPDVAATFAKRWDAEVGGNWACCGTVQWDGFGWESWLNSYLAAGGPVPPYWHIHAFDRWPYPPVRAFAAWMEANDVVRPVIVSEAAAPWDDAAANAEYMTALAQMVADGELHAVLWYSAPADYWKLWPDADLMDWDATQLTPLGEHWLALQPGGASDPRATPTMEPTARAEPRREWLPAIKRFVLSGGRNYVNFARE